MMQGRGTIKSLALAKGRLKKLEEPRLGTKTRLKGCNSIASRIRRSARRLKVGGRVRKLTLQRNFTLPRAQEDSKSRGEKQRSSQENNPIRRRGEKREC